MHARNYEVPDEIRKLCWSMLVVHLRKLDWLIRRGETRGAEYKELRQVRKYLGLMVGDTPDDPEFVEWCREALECMNVIAAATKQPMLEVLDGGAGDGE